MKILFENKKAASKVNWISIVLVLLLNVLISVASSMLFNVIRAGTFEVELITLFLIFSAASFRLFINKTLISISFDASKQALMVYQRNGLQVAYSKYFRLKETVLSPITEDSGELQFDLSTNNRYIRVSSDHKGISKSDVQALYDKISNDYAITVAKLR